MSSSTPIPLAPELTIQWEKATDDVLKPASRYLQIKIIKEVLSLVAKSAGSPSVSKDFDELKSLVNEEPCYFLFRIGGAKNWILISYVPPTAKTPEKMLYAATKNTLKMKLGPKLINEDLLFSTPAELSYGYYLKNKEPTSALSEFEKVRIKVRQAEDEERVARSEGSQKSGGYHQVKIPLTAAAKEEIERVKSGLVNFIEFRIKADVVEHVQSKSVGGSELASNVKGAEPRFYLYSYQKIRSPGQPKAHAFIYYCPDSSPAPLRMVYATSKPTLAQQITALGLQVAKRLEIRDGTELTEEYLKSELFPSAASRLVAGSSLPPRLPSPANKPMNIRPLSAKSSVVSSKSAPAPHPIYSLMNTDSPTSSKKRVVIPPPGAYC